MSSSIAINRSKLILRQLNRPRSTVVFIALFAVLLGALSITTARPANASTSTVNVDCSVANVLTVGTNDIPVTAYPGDTINLSSSAGTCNSIYFVGGSASTFGASGSSEGSIPGTYTLNVDSNASPNTYYVLFYDSKNTRPPSVDDWGARLNITIPAPTDPNSITSCAFNPTSNSVNYGETVTSTVTLAGTSTISGELWFWHKRILDGTEITTGDPDQVSQADILINTGTTYTYGSSISTAGYYYPNHTLVEEFYAINVGKTAPVGSALCTVTTTFGPAPSTTGTQQIAYTSESCANIKNNNAKLVSNLVATIAKQGNKSYISGINPGSAFYWAKVNLNGSTSTSLFTQSSSNSPIRLAPMGSNYIYDSNCNLIKKGPKVSVDSNGSSASFSGGVSGATYYIAIKLGPNYIVNQPVPSSWPVTLTFSPGFGASTFDVIINSKK